MGYARIELSSRERKLLESRTRGKTSASEARRARCLLLADAGYTEAEVAEAVGCGTATVTRVKSRYRKEGWEAAIVSKHGGGRPHRLGPLEQRQLIALACSERPEGGAVDHSSAIGNDRDSEDDGATNIGARWHQAMARKKCGASQNSTTNILNA